MTMKFYSLLLAFFLSGCFDLMDQDEMKIKENIYAIHSAGIDGYSIEKKISETGSIPIIDACVIAVYYSEDFSNILAKRIDKINSTDTIYLKYAVSASVLDTISKEQFYSSVVNLNKEIILLPPKN